MFQTRPDGPLTGHPLPSPACRCETRQALHRGSCITCGRFPDWTIRKTWADQAKRAARGQRNVIRLREELPELTYLEAMQRAA